MHCYRGSTAWVRVLILIIPYLLIVGIFQLIGFLILGFDLSELSNVSAKGNPAVQATLLFFSLLGTIFVIWLFTKTIDKKRFVQIGLQLKNLGNNLAGGLLLGIAIIATGFLLLLTLGQIEVDSFNFSTSNTLLSIAIYTMVSLSEEFLCRGYILRNLMISFNRYFALIISSIIFALLHIGNSHIGWIGFTNLILAGIILGLPYIFTKSLWHPIGMHFTWNLTQAFLGFNVSGNTTFSIVQLRYTGNNFLHGGEFGFEGSILCTIISVIAAIFLWRHLYGKEKDKRLQSKIVKA
jgi:membrane protease YdiL (CAAX protease family)